jgi:tRNA-2-methylthio-N6-dimethylallyladenosine synthase
VIDALTLPKQVNYLHLPVQAGSSEVLRRMNRKYTREKFLEVIAKVKAKRPEIALGTDIIVGFPGETPEQFDETVSLYAACDFDISYTAQYSPRSGTLGVKLFPDDVMREEKRRRWDILQKQMEQTTLRKNKTYIGKTVSVLVERVEAGFASGLSREMKLVRFKTTDPSLVGKIVPVAIKIVQEWQLMGDVVS